MGFFLFYFNLGFFSPPQEMGLGANIWSETGRGEGRPGDSERGGGRNRGRKAFSGFILAAWGSAGSLISQKSRERGGVCRGGGT